MRHLATMCGMILFFGIAIHVVWSAAVSVYAKTAYSHRIYDVTRFGAEHWHSVNARVVNAYVASQLDRNVITTVGSSFTFGYSFDEKYTVTAALARRGFQNINVSVIGYTILGIYQTLCSIENQKADIETLIVEIPLINEIGGLAKDYPTHWEMECYSIPAESLFAMALQLPLGIGWSHFLFDPYARSAPFETANVSKVPKGYFVDFADFQKIKSSHLADLRELVTKSKAVAKKAYFFVTPLDMRDLAKAGADEANIREQYDLTQRYCQELAGDRCVTTDQMLDDPTLFSNITHINGKGAEALAGLIASKLNH